MTCQKCSSQNVTVNVVNEVQLKDKHHGFFWWIFIGWWWVPIKWLVFTIPALILAIFGRKKQKAINHQVTVCVCQNCGNRWEIR